jgi:hypothetical protein
MRAFAVGVGVVVAAAVAAGAYVAVRSRAPDLGPAGPNRELAPDTIAVYVEAADAKTTWSKMQTTEAWRDFTASKAAAALLDLAAVKDLLAAVDQVAAKAAYPVDAANAMKFLGRECSMGIELDAQGGAPRVLVLTKLDVDALTKDLVRGKTDLGALWDELQKRTGQCDFHVKKEEYKGHVVAVATRDAASFHAALLGDTLAVSGDGGLLRRAIDCRASGGERSLGRKPAFQTDVAATPAGATAFEWYDFDALDEGRKSLDAGLASLGASAELVGALHGVLDGVRGSHSCARYTTLADGDLYKLTWNYSKTADLFADKASPPLRDLYFGDWIAYAEAHDVGGVVAAWNKSALRRRLGASEVGKWLGSLIDDPAKKAAEVASTFGVSAPDPLDVDEEKPDEKRKPDAKTGFLDRFAGRFTWHVVSDRIHALSGGDAAFGVDATSGKSKRDAAPRMAFAVRLDAEARLVVLAAQGALAARKKSPATCEEVGSRKVFTADARDLHFLWTLVGDALVVSNDADLVHQAARSGDTKPLGPPARIRDAVATMKPGWRGFLFVDMDHGFDALKRWNGARPDQDMSAMFDTQRSAGLVGGQIALTTYVADDFSSIEIRTRSSLPEPKDPDWKRYIERSEPREPLSWNALPDTTFAHVTAPSSGVDLLWFVFKFTVATMHADLASIESDFRQSMGMDLEKELLPALGREVVCAMTFCKAPPAGKHGPRGDGPILVPGFVLGVEVKDVATVKRAVDRALEIAEEKIRESDPSTPAKLFVREPHDGAEIVRVTMPPEAQEAVTFQPALALHDGYLFVSTDFDAIRAGVDARNGKGKSLADSPAFARATASLDKKCASFALLDWPKMVDQIAEYEPQIATLFARSESKYPDFPANGDAEEWQRRMKAYEQKIAEGKTAGVEKAKKWIDALRVVDFVGSSSRVDGRTSEATMIVKFAE